MDSTPARHVVITGGTQGLGRALALTFGAAGYRPTCIYRANHDAAQALEADFVSRGIAGRCLAWDVAHGLPELPELADGGTITLINNACPPFEPKPFHLIDVDEVRAGLEVMVSGSLRCIQDALRPMVRSGGTVINILSAVTVGVPPKGFAGYTAAKYALMGLGRAVAGEYRDRGVRVLSVSPGFMETTLTRAWDPLLTRSLVTDGAAQSAQFVAERVLTLAEDVTLPHRGENYVIEP